MSIQQDSESIFNSAIGEISIHDRWEMIRLRRDFDYSFNEIAIRFDIITSQCIFKLWQLYVHTNHVLTIEERWQIINIRIQSELSFGAIANDFNVEEETIREIWQLYQETGNVVSNQTSFLNYDTSEDEDDDDDDDSIQSSNGDTNR